MLMKLIPGVFIIDPCDDDIVHLDEYGSGFGHHPQLLPSTTTVPHPLKMLSSEQVMTGLSLKSMEKSKFTCPTKLG